MRLNEAAARELFDALTPESIFDSPILPAPLRPIVTGDGGILCFKYFTLDVSTGRSTEVKQSFNGVEWADVPADQMVLMIHVEFSQSRFLGDSLHVNLVVAKRKRFGRDALGRDFIFADIDRFDHETPTRSKSGACLFVSRMDYRAMYNILRISSRGVHPIVQRQGVMRLTSTRLLLLIERVLGAVTVKSDVEHWATACFYLFTKDERTFVRARTRVLRGGKLDVSLELSRPIAELVEYHQKRLADLEEAALMKQAVLDARPSALVSQSLVVCSESKSDGADEAVDRAATDAAAALEL